jgi:hypothetical protein
MNRSSDWQTFASGSIVPFPPEEHLLEEEDQRSGDRKEGFLQATEAGLAILERALQVMVGEGVAPPGWADRHLDVGPASLLARVR